MCVRYNDNGCFLDDGGNADGGHLSPPGRSHALARGHRVKTAVYELPQGQYLVFLRSCVLIIFKVITLLRLTLLYVTTYLISSILNC